MNNNTVNLVINANSLGEAWIKSLRKVMDEGFWILDEEDRLIEIRNLQVKIKYISEDDPIIRNYADQDRISIMKLKYLSCQIVYNYKVSYGKLLYDNNGVNQIDWVVNKLIEKPETKSATISLHHPGDEYLSCLSLLDYKLRDGYLSMTAVYRSQNVFGSQPGNVIALRGVHEHVAKKIGAQLGELNLALLSAHIYEKDLEKAKRILETLHSLPKITDIVKQYI